MIRFFTCKGYSGSLAQAEPYIRLETSMSVCSSTQKSFSPNQYEQKKYIIFCLIFLINI